MQADWWRYDPASRLLTLTVHVQRNARVSGIAGLHGGALKVRVAAPAVDDKANAALVAYVAQTLGVAASRVALKRGARGRRKSVEIREAPPDLVARIEATLTG